MQCSLIRRGTIFQWKVYERGTFSVKNGIYKGKGLDLGVEPSRIKTLLGTPLPPPERQSSLKSCRVIVGSRVANGSQVYILSDLVSHFAALSANYDWKHVTWFIYIYIYWISVSRTMRLAVMCDIFRIQRSVNYDHSGECSPEKDCFG